jgi:hypothetical protein
MLPLWILIRTSCYARWHSYSNGILEIEFQL